MRAYLANRSSGKSRDLFSDQRSAIDGAIPCGVRFDAWRAVKLELDVPASSSSNGVLSVNAWNYSILGRVASPAVGARPILDLRAEAASYHTFF